MAKAAKKTTAPVATKAQAKPATRAIAKAKAKPAAAEADEEDEAPAPRFVVGHAYKLRYRSRENSNKGRNNADWLAQRLVALVLNEDRKLDVAKLEAICAANAVPATYENRSLGWQGRMRMTLGLRLRPIVAAQGFLAVPNGKRTEKQPAPADFIALWRK